MKRFRSVVLAGLMLQAVALPAFAKTDAEKEAKRAEKVRAQIAKLGTGKDALVKIELRDKTKLEGYVSGVSAEGFVVTDKAGKATAVAYPQVGKAKGNNLSTGAKIAIGAAAVAAIILLMFWHRYSENEGG